MAIYHFSVQVIGRAAGRSVVAAAAYRSASRLRDDRLGRDQDFSAKRGVVHSEVMLPENAPEEWNDREKLWNDVEAFEKRKDAQLCREVEFALPREMTERQGVELARDFAQAEFVDQGMIADVNVHWDIGEDGMPKPHAHVMLTMRSVDDNGFGQKVREWNRTELVERWRERWADHVNERLAELDIDARIDHRSLEAQGIGLEPQTKIGAPAQRIEATGIEADRAEDHRRIARENGARIIHAMMPEPVFPRIRPRRRMQQRIGKKIPRRADFSADESRRADGHHAFPKEIVELRRGPIGSAIMDRGLEMRLLEGKSFRSHPHVHTNLGMPRIEAGQARDQPMGGKGRQHRQFQLRATTMGHQGCGIPVQGLDRAANLGRVKPPRARQTHTLLDAHKKRDVEIAFQQGDLPRNGAFRQAKVPGGQSETLIARRRLEGQ